MRMAMTTLTISPGVADGNKSAYEKQKSSNALPSQTSSSDSGDGLLSDGSSFGNVLEGLLHALRETLVHQSTGDANHGNDRGHGMGELPLADECEDETDDKSGQEIGGHAVFSEIP